jgi:hypothetical protein
MRALKVYLHGLRGDVRESNKQAFRLQEYSRYSEVEELVRELYLWAAFSLLQFIYLFIISYCLYIIF